MKKSLFTITSFAKINTKRFFRDKTAIFFTVAFPLIFLAIFGSMFGGDVNISFKIALINNSESQIAAGIEEQIKQSELFTVDESLTTVEAAEEDMQRSLIDATVVIPENFGGVEGSLSTGELQIYYNQNNQDAAITLQSIFEAQLNELNNQFVDTSVPFTVTTISTNTESLTQFDYTFAGLLGFAIIALGIFGPTTVFPELKKQGVLRRLHTTPIKVWQYFTSNVASQGLIGLFAIAIQFVFAVIVFDLQMKGSFLAFIPFVLLSIIMIYGIGLAIGGWARNERQAAPLGNLVSFPMIFLSGTFFPRFLMPEWLQSITSYLPLTPVIDGIRLIVTEGKGLIEIGSQIAIISVWAVIIYLVAFRVFRWE